MADHVEPSEESMRSAGEAPRESVARRLEQEKRFPEAAEAWKTIAARTPAGKIRAAALAEHGRLLAGPLGRSREAALVFRRALANDPSAAPALDGLCEIASEAGDWACVAGAKAGSFRSEPDAARRAELGLEIGRIEREQLHSPSAARRWFRDALECAPDRIDILEELTRIERNRSDDAALLVSLERLIERQQEAAATADLLEAAALRSDRGEHTRALAHLERASARAPEDALILDALADVLTALEKFPALADVLERRVALAADAPDVRSGVLMELGALCEERLFDPEAALEAYERALADGPETPGLLPAVDRLRAKLDPDRDRAAEPAGSGLSELEASESRLARLERDARTTHDRGRLGELVREIQQIHQQNETPDQALPWVQRWASASPEEPDALRALARLHDRPGHEAELTATLEALDPLLELSEQGANRRQIGALYEARERLPEAIRAYRRALDLDASDLESLERLASLLRRTDDFEARASVLGRLLELRPLRDRSATLAEIAEVHEARGDLSAMIVTLETLEHETDAPEHTQTRLDELLEQTNRIEDLNERLRQRAETFESNSADAVALHLRRAALQLDALDQPDEAATIFRAVLDHAPKSEEATRGLEKALRRSIDADGLAAFLTVQIENTNDPELRDRAALERALLFEEALERPQEALDAYAALASDASDLELRREAASHYERLLEQQSDWSTLRQHLESSIAIEGCDEVALRERLAQLCRQRLRDAAGELANLERLVEIAPARGDVWRTLADRYEDADRIQDMVRVMEGELVAGCDAGRALTLHARLAETYSNVLRDDTRAGDHYERVFELDPSHTSAASHLLGRYEEDRRPEDVVRVLESRLAAHRDAGIEPDEQAISHRTALRVHIAQVRAQQLGDTEGAISALEVALGEAGAISQVAEPLAECYLQAEYAVDLIELCQSAAAACSEGAEAANWHVRMGDAYLSRERPGEAAQAYRRALSERPDDRTVQASLRAIYRHLDDPAALAPLLEAELAHLAGPEEVPVRLELVPLLAGQLDRKRDALLHARRVLQLAPGHREAFELAVALASEVDEPTTTLGLIDRRIEQSLEPVECVTLLDRRAQILAGPLERPEEAIDALETALELVPSSHRRRELMRLYERTGRPAEQIAMLSELARQAHGEDRIELLEQATLLAQEHLDPAATLPWLERLRREQPTDVGVLKRIAAVHRELGQTESLVRVLDEAAGVATDPADRRALRLQRAALLQTGGEANGRAIATLQAAREDDPNDVEILERIERLQATAGRKHERVDTLEALLAVQPENALHLHRELARLHEELRSSSDVVEGHWHAALEATAEKSSGRIEILQEVAEARRRTGNLEGWAETAERELAALGTEPVFDERRRELHRELALTYNSRLARPNAALNHIRVLLDSEDATSLGSEVVDQLEDTALRLLREADTPVEHESRLARHLKRRPEDANLWFELATLRETKLHWTRAAIDAYRQALEQEPDRLDALRGLQRAAEKLGRWNDVVDALKRELEHPEVDDAKTRSRLLRRLGDVYWHRLQSTTRASQSYAAALEANGSDFAALRALERLLEAMEDWRGAMDLYESEVEVLGDDNPPRRRDIWIHVAGIASDHTDDFERARRAWMRADELAPLDADGLAALANLHLRAGDPEAFIESFALWCDAEGTQPSASHLLRLAHALEERDRPREALPYVERALEIDDQSSSAWDDAARLRERLGDGTAAAAALRDSAERGSDNAAVERLRHAARLLEHTSSGEALETLRTAVARDPSDIDARASQTRLALELGHLDEAEEAAARALDGDVITTLGLEGALAVALQGGDAARLQGRWEAAVAFYERARAIQPDDATALARLGESLMKLGDSARARNVFEARLAGGEAYPERASHRLQLALCLEAEGEIEPAIDSAEAALEDDPKLDEALGATVRLNEALVRVDDCIAALERWARRSDTEELRAERLLRAAEWEIRTGEREDAAEAHLRQALRAAPSNLAAWTLLASLLSGQGRYDAAIETVDRAAQFATRNEDIATLALIQGRAFEDRGERPQSADAFGFAAEADPQCCEAALAQARLLRGAGEWRDAANALEAFLDRHPNPEDPALAEVLEQHGRLLAGPLEDVDQAVLIYRRALKLAPDTIAARAPLAELLSHRAGDHPEALEHLRVLLAADPTHATGIRVGLRIARTRETGAGPDTGIAILRGLGVASPYEAETQCAPLSVGSPGLRDADSEQLRQVVVEASAALAEALGASGSGPTQESPDSECAFRDAMRQAEATLSAPALIPLATDELAEVIRLTVQLSVDPDSVNGDGRLVNALSSALRRRLRRKLRKLIGETPVANLCAIDFDQWRCDIRALAAATALETTGSELRPVLTALLREDSSHLDANVAPEANLTPLVAASPVAKALLRRWLADWLGRI